MSELNENRDGLTGLWNRKYAFQKLEEAVATCSQVALILIDIDQLRIFHGAYGHPPTDEVIIEVGREIETLSGDNALACRYGGDEFFVILPECSLERAREIAETIRSYRKSLVFDIEKFHVEIEPNNYLMITLSLGVAHFPTQVSSAEHLLHAADLALMKAKGEGKKGGRFRDGTPYTARNRVIAIGDFLDDFPEQSARFLKPEWIITDKSQNQN